jgi:hypothetical protein
MPEMGGKFNTQVAKAAIAIFVGLLMTGSARAAGVACAVKAGPLLLTNFSLIDGPPAEQAFLAPDRTRTSATGIINQWSLAKNNRGYWLRCEYGSRSIDLKLSDGVRQCSARYDKQAKLVLDGKQPVCR